MIREGEVVRLAALWMACSGALAFAALAQPEQPRIIGEHRRDVVLETPHPYPGARGAGSAPAWTDRHSFPGAAYLVFEFERFDLAPGDWLEVRDPQGKQVHVYRGRGPGEKGGGFISKMILGSRAVLELHSTHPKHDHYGYRIERITRGYNEVELQELYGDAYAPEAICGGDDKEDALCYETAFPDVYAAGRGVARIVMDGSALCTAWLVSCDNHLMTNNHCTWDDDDFDTQGELDRMEFQFQYQDDGCGGGNPSVEYSFMGGTWIENDHDLDYTLIQAPAGEDPAGTYGWLPIDNRLVDVDELIYIVGHPNGRPKEIALYSTEPADQDNPDGFCEVFSTDEPVCVGGSVPEIGYHCDTEGGNSGSPVLSRVTNKVVALHHCANCPNRGVRIQDIWAANQAGANPLPACSLSREAGQVSLDGDLYACSDTLSIHVLDDSIRGAGTQDVSVASSTEAGGETVSLAETPADSGKFVGGLATTTPPPLPDGLLSVVHGDTITVTYIDADDGQGGAGVTLQDSASTDCREPEIQGVTVTDVFGDAATVSWDTDEPADATVFYRTGAQPWAQASTPGLSTSHSVALSGLSQCTPYEVRVQSADPVGNTAEDDNGGVFYPFSTGVDVRPTHSSVDPPVAINDNQSSIMTIAVPDDDVVEDVDVTLFITHTYADDLEIYLEGPNGVEILLSADNGGSANDYTGTTFDDEASVDITAGSAPFSGSFRPEQALSAFDGIAAQGVWTLRVHDDAGADTGTLDAWSLRLTYPARECGPHAEYAAHGLELDACAAGGAHDDGSWDAGESVTFRVTLENDGSEPLTGITATVSSPTPGVTVSAATASYPDLDPGASAESAAPHYTVELPAGLACGAILDFLVDIQADQGSWSEPFQQVAGTVLPGTETVLSEDFSAGIPGLWSVVDGGNSGDSWYADDSTDPLGCDNPDPAFPLSGTWAAVDSDCALSVDMDESLVTPVLDLSDTTSVILEFDHYFNNFELEVADLDVRSTLTGGSWTNVARWLADTVNPQHESFDLTGLAAGALDVEIRWHYYDANFEWYWYVDNVVVQAATAGGCAMTACPVAGDPPGEQTGVAWADFTSLEWDADPEAGSGYRLYRGTAADLPALGTAGTTDSCTRFTGVDQDDNRVDLGSDDPGDDGFHWYLVSGLNPSGEGPLGSGTAGVRMVDTTGSCP